MTRPVAFLFLGETLLIPHLWPIVEALAARSAVPIDLYVSTSMHETLLAGWRDPAWGGRVRIRRAPGFRRVADDADGRNPVLPAKLPMLLRLTPALRRARAVVCAEQTSLWLPRLLPMRAPFVKTSHGVGAMSSRDDARRRAATLTLVPSERERGLYLDRGMPPAAIVATGYVKAAFRHHRRAAPFADDRPVVLYNPHWQPHRSSWPRWGAQVVDAIVAGGRCNLIFAPHQRLVERAPEVAAVAARLAGRRDVLCDLDSFAAVDGSYTAAADIYLGDTSSQVNEFLMRPRPCVFLNAHGTAWRDDPSHANWHAGEVVDAVEDVVPALGRAVQRHAAFVAYQRAFAADTLGDVTGAGAIRAAEEILALVGPGP